MAKSMNAKKKEFKDFIKTIEQLDSQRILLVQNAANVLLTQQMMEQQREKSVGK